MPQYNAFDNTNIHTRWDSNPGLLVHETELNQNHKYKKTLLVSVKLWLLFKTSSIIYMHVCFVQREKS